MATKNNLKKKTLSQLKAIAVTHFHKYIRNRDNLDPCISCGQYTAQPHASHFYSAGQNPVLKFDPLNVHKSCLRCNYFLAGNLIPYRQNLIKKIGLEQVKKLDFKVALSKQTGFKWDRFFLIEIIEKYKAINKLEYPN
jgi:hypothetical protein